MTDWTERIEKGDVIRSKRGRLRVVRAVHRWKTRRGNMHTSVTLSILHPSWTSRPYTVVNHHDLHFQGYRPTRAKWPLDSEFDRRLERQFGLVPVEMTAWDILGVA